MAGTDRLRPVSPGGQESAAGPRVATPPEVAELLEPDRTPQRATVYWVLVLVLLAGTLILRGSPWNSGRELHTLLETASTVMAGVVGALALVRYYSKTRRTYLFIGTGFVGTAVLEGYHAVVSSDLFAGRTLVELQDTTAWSWLGARLFLALFLYVSWLAWHREEWEKRAEEVTERSVYVTAVLLAALILGFVAFVPTTRAYYPELPVYRPAEFLPALFFLLALGGYLSKGTWRRDPFEHWLIVALVLNAMTHAAYMPFSARLHDAAYDAAHFLKLASYVAVLTGVMVSVYVTFRREGRAMEQVQNANDALAREVAVRRRAERVLQESEERLQDFLDNANDLIQSTAPDGTILYVNRAWTRTLGYEEDEAVGREMLEFVHPRSRDRCEELLERVLDGESVAGTEVEFVAADGRVIVCSGSMNCRFEDGEPAATRSIFRDVTEQRRAEREIATSRANLEALVESTGDAIWSVDADHRLITFNTAFALSMEARTGREPGKGDTPDEVFASEAVPWYREQYERALSGERFSVLRSEEVQGRLRHLEFFFNPIVEEGISGVVAFGRDVTRRIHAERALRLAKEEAEAANRAKTHFLANMSHELRTPLNSVIGFTNILLKNQEENLTDKQLNFLDRVLANGRHLLTLINEVLDLAKVESGRTELELEPVDLEEMVHETVAQLEGQVRAQKGDRVQLRAEVPDDLEPLETDRAKLKQVIINLVGNALKFTDEGEVAVIVEASEGGHRARSIHVRDTGIGIPDDRLEAIFEAFQQADDSTSRKYGGTGLGLTISRSICQMLGYEIGVDSDVGVGSTFSIHVDASRDEAGEEDERWKELPEAAVEEVDEGTTPGSGPLPSEPESAVHGYRVLVVDDEADSRVLMSHFLRDYGCEVLTADSGREGLELAREENPDLITLDLMMPDMDGWETLRRLKEDPELKEIPVVVVSIAASENRGSLLGAMDLVNKPVEREDLLRVLWRNVMGGSGNRVLVVDDEADTRALFRRYLEDAGLDVVTAHNGADALQKVASEGPDAIVLDLLMPVMDGMTFLERLRQMPDHVGVPVIVVTAKELDEEELEILRKQAAGVVSKAEDDVEDRLREYLAAVFELETQDAGA